MNGIEREFSLTAQMQECAHIIWRNTVAITKASLNVCVTVFQNAECPEKPPIFPRWSIALHQIIILSLAAA